MATTFDAIMDSVFIRTIKKVLSKFISFTKYVVRWKFCEIWKNLMGIGFQIGQILWDFISLWFISQCEIWHVCWYWRLRPQSLTLQFLGPHYFQTLWCIWFMFDTTIDSGPYYFQTLLDVFDSCLIWWQILVQNFTQYHSHPNTWP